MESKHIVLCNIISVFQRIVKLHPQTFKFYSKGGYPYTIKELKNNQRRKKIKENNTFYDDTATEAEFYIHDGAH